MPFVGSSGILSPPPRKRRWQDDDEDDKRDDVRARHPRGLFAVCRPEPDTASPQRCPFAGDCSPYSIPRRMAASVSKRTRLNDDDDEDRADGPDADFASPHRRRLAQLTQRRQRTASPPQNVSAAAAAAASRPSRSLLAPCHVCHRRPTKKSELDSFARCQGCREQTCFVCIRQCHHATSRRCGGGGGGGGGGGDNVSSAVQEGALSRSLHMCDADEVRFLTDEDDVWTAAACPRGHQTSPARHPGSSATAATSRTSSAQDWIAHGHCSVICSRCCVEKGPEGEVVCLGCLLAPEDMIL